MKAINELSEISIHGISPWNYFSCIEGRIAQAAISKAWRTRSGGLSGSLHQGRCGIKYGVIRRASSERARSVFMLCPV